MTPLDTLEDWTRDAYPAVGPVWPLNEQLSPAAFILILTSIAILLAGLSWALVKFLGGSL